MVSSTIPVVEAIRAHEPIFRNILRDVHNSARTFAAVPFMERSRTMREDYLPSNFDPEAPLENLLRYVPSTTDLWNVKDKLKIYVFSVGPSFQLFSEKLTPTQAMFGYAHQHFTTRLKGAVMLYDILENNAVRHVEDILRGI